MWADTTRPQQVVEDDTTPIGPIADGLELLNNSEVAIVNGGQMDAPMAGHTTPHSIGTSHGDPSRIRMSVVALSMMAQDCGMFAGLLTSADVPTFERMKMHNFTETSNQYARLDAEECCTCSFSLTGRVLRVKGYSHKV